MVITSLLLSSLGVNAQNHVKPNRYSKLIIPEGVKYEQTNLGNNTLYAPVCTAGEKNAKEVSVTFKCTGEAGVKPSQGTIYNATTKKPFYFNGMTETEITVPEGIYDVYVSYYDYTSYYVFKENVEVKDGSVIEFDQRDAVNDVSFRFYDENEKELFMTVYDGATLHQEGTADTMTKFTAFNHKEYGNVGLILSMGFMPKGYPMEFFVNDLSDKYVVGLAANIIANGVTYTYKDVVKECKKGIEKELGGSDLMECVTTINVPDIMNGDKNAFIPGYNFSILYKGLACIGERGFLPKSVVSDNKVINYMYTPESVSEDDEVNVIYSPILSNYYENVEDDWGKYSYYFGISGCAMLGDKNGVKYINAGSDASWYGFSTPQGRAENQFYPGHPDLSYENKDGKMTFGNCCPATSIRALRYYVDGIMDGWDGAIFTGRYGELYETEGHVLVINDEIMDDGRTKSTIVNDLVFVDGEAGHNYTEYVRNTEGEDFIAPTLQMLTFKNAKGEITDRLEEAKGSKLIFTGGDFDYNFDALTWSGYFSIGAADVEVAYTERGTENWRKLVVNEIPEKRMMPYFGNFYEASLDDVIAENDDQWFDLLIKFKDAAGNYQNQLLSPAFMIKNNNNTGIDDISSDKSSLYYINGSVRMSGSDTARLEIRNMAGTLVRTANGNKISTENLIAGAYIVTASTNNNGTLVKKILIN